jgi:hypothetical protein
VECFVVSYVFLAYLVYHRLREQVGRRHSNTCSSLLTISESPSGHQHADEEEKNICCPFFFPFHYENLYKERNTHIDGDSLRKLTQYN